MSSFFKETIEWIKIIGALILGIAWLIVILLIVHPVGWLILAISYLRFMGVV